MGTICCGKHCLWLACCLSTLWGLSSAVQAAGNGEIVVTRTVQPYAVGNPPMHPDPNPRTVNTNPSAHILNVTHELSDGDFAGVSSGASISRAIMPSGGTLPGLNTSNGLPGMRSGHGGASGGGMSNTINRSIQQGMRPLTSLGQGK